MGDIMLKSNIGRLIDESPYKNEYVKSYMGVSRNSLSNWRTGKVIISMEKAYALSRLLDCKVDDLYTLIEDETEF